MEGREGGWDSLPVPGFFGGTSQGLHSVGFESQFSRRKVVLRIDNGQG